MLSKTNSSSPLPKRLKEARKAAGLSQRKLGVLSGIDEFCAGPRVNQYEKGTHTPSYQLVKTFGEKLGVPTHYFFIEDDHLAEIALRMNTLSYSIIDELLTDIESPS